MADFSLEKYGDLPPQGPAPHGQSSAGRQHPPPLYILGVTLPFPIPPRPNSAHFEHPLAAWPCLHLHIQPFLEGPGYILFMCIWFLLQRQ